MSAWFLDSELSTCFKSSHNILLKYSTGGWKFILLVDTIRQQQNWYLYKQPVTHVWDFEISSRLFWFLDFKSNFSNLKSLKINQMHKISCLRLCACISKVSISANMTNLSCKSIDFMILRRDRQDISQW